MCLRLGWVILQTHIIFCLRLGRVILQTHIMCLWLSLVTHPNSHNVLEVRLGHTPNSHNILLEVRSGHPPNSHNVLEVRLGHPNLDSSNIHICPELKLNWVPTQCKVLGVSISRDMVNMLQLPIQN